MKAFELNKLSQENSNEKLKLRDLKSQELSNSEEYLKIVERCKEAAKKGKFEISVNVESINEDMFYTLIYNGFKMKAYGKISWV